MDFVSLMKESLFDTSSLMAKKPPNHFGDDKELKMIQSRIKNLKALIDHLIVSMAKIAKNCENFFEPFHAISDCSHSIGSNSDKKIEKFTELQDKMHCETLNYMTEFPIFKSRLISFKSEFDQLLKNIDYILKKKTEKSQIDAKIDSFNKTENSSNFSEWNFFKNSSKKIENFEQFEIAVSSAKNFDTLIKGRKIALSKNLAELENSLRNIFEEIIQRLIYFQNDFFNKNSKNILPLYNLFLSNSKNEKINDKNLKNSKEKNSKNSPKKINKNNEKNKINENFIQNSQNNQKINKKIENKVNFNQNNTKLSRNLTNFNQNFEKSPQKNYSKSKSTPFQNLIYSDIKIDHFNDKSENFDKKFDHFNDKNDNFGNKFDHFNDKNHQFSEKTNDFFDPLTVFNQNSSTNNQNFPKNDQKSSKNDQNFPKNNQKSSKNDQKSSKNDKNVQKLLLNWEYKNGERRGIRTLLATLHTVLWDGAKSNWAKTDLSELMSESSVKRKYRQAILVIHPDRNSGISNFDLSVSQAVFAAVSKAFDDFRKENVSL